MDAADGFEGESARWRRENSGVQEEKKRGETKQLESWRWLKNGFLKKETEGFILAAQ